MRNSSAKKGCFGMEISMGEQAAGCKNGFRILSPGALTTIQDAGRVGYGDRGFSPSGAVDQKAMEIANILVGNAGKEAVLECTLMGPTLVFTCNTVIALTGADMQAKLSGTDIPVNQAVPVHAGAMLQMGVAIKGCRGYLAVAGGMQIPEVLGSKSLHLKCGIGGGFGRALRAGDEIRLCREIPSFPDLAARVYQEPVTRDRKERVVHVVMGPQESYFTAEGIEIFQTGSYAVSNDSNRMACKMTGAKIACKSSSDIISDGIALGSVQISSNGQPIVMLADRQTTGGYAKIATVISTDISILAQCKPGDRIHFQPVSLREAQKRYKKQSRELQRFAKRMAPTEQGTAEQTIEKQHIIIDRYHGGLVARWTTQNADPQEYGV